ncbi:hypothetical protein BAnh1_10840 [Bartonella australis AUST/NH1]|uniref:Uncharacterized protein n=1 Tax=Bartonella australis (strain Aust/NH1) TaxID=1094489 RepID=M1NZY1_BARAA|nr:hypothetical protein [Bartonella australis]AGF74952.1 hypothetical protein BAnh1_10840 [Bartonella australis AUST/NH1]
MALFPFSIADIGDPEHIRIVIYSGGQMGHAPLNGLLDQIRKDAKREDKKRNQDYAQLLQRVSDLEEKLKNLTKA